MTKYDALIFDMDGLLVDSEPLWHEAEVAMIEGAGYIYEDAVREQTIGVRVDEFSRIIHRHYPRVGETPAAIADEISRRILRLERDDIQPRPGAEAIVRYAAEKRIPRAIASSSESRVIERFVRLLDWDRLIPMRFSAERMPLGKPAPDIYLHAAAELGVAPERCLALEDSVTGTKAALAAGMTCFSVPDPTHADPADFAMLDARVFDSLHDALREIETKGYFA